MATFSVALLIILIGFWLCASSVRADEQQNQNKCENQNALAEKMLGIEAKLEQIENGMRDTQNLLSTKLENGMRDNQNTLAEKMAGIGTNLEKQIENGIREIQNALAEKMAGNEAQLEKQIENGKFDNQNGPIYRWNASDCHPEIVINERTNAIQRNATGTGEFPGFCSCRAAPIQMPSAAAGRIGIIYAEYRILALAKDGAIFIGLSTKEMPLDTRLGLGRVSYGYVNVGNIESKNANGLEKTISYNMPSLSIGDVGGCGLNLATHQLFFTNNGQRLNITNLYVVEDTADFYPTVSLWDYGDAVKANFGPNFKYDLSKEF